MTPTQKIKAAVAKIEKQMNINQEIRGHYADDLFHKDMELVDFKTSMEELFWEDVRHRELLAILLGEQ
jgi:hypothetical protein